MAAWLVCYLTSLPSTPTNIAIQNKLTIEMHDTGPVVVSDTADNDSDTVDNDSDRAALGDGQGE